MTRKSSSKRDRIEHPIESALNPGVFIVERACFSFVSDLQQVAAKIATLTGTEPSRAVDLYETFLAGCYEKANELDDSSGSFGQFVEDLFCGWIKARQAADADPEETAARLLAWMDDDPWGFCHSLEKDAVKVLNRAGLAAFERRIRVRFSSAAIAKPATDGSRARPLEYERRRWGEALRTVYAAQRNVAAYVALAEQTGLTPADCHAIARLLAGRRKLADALTWVERGLGIERSTPHDSMAGYDLRKLKRDLLVKLGRRNEALEAAWADFREHPSRYSYEDLMTYVPRAQRSSWHARAIEAARGGDLDSVIELLTETRDLARLADLVRETAESALEGVSHHVTEPAAIKLEKRHPDAAARLWCALGMCIVNAKKSKYYDIALERFEQAKRCYQRAGLLSDWESVVNRVRASHHRKMGFMSGFENVAAGCGPSSAPSFLERAKAKWRERQP